MLKAATTQIKIMVNKKGFRISFTLVVLICMAELIFNCFGVTYYRGLDDGFAHNDKSSVMSSFEAFILCDPSSLLGYVKLLFPFLCALPFSFSILTDKLTSSDTLYCAYAGKKRYVFSKIIAVFFGSFIIFFVPFLCELALNYLIFDNSIGADIFNPNWNFTGKAVLRSTDYPSLAFANLLAFSPFLYSLLYAFLFSLMSGVFGVFALATSVFCRRNKAMTFISGFVLLNVLQFVEDYNMNDTNWDKKYTAMYPFDYVTYYYRSGRFGLNYPLFFAFLAVILAISITVLLVSAKKDII